MVCMHCFSEYLGYRTSKYCSPKCSVLSKTAPSINGCIEFTGNTCKGGYGAIRFRGVDMKSHRAIWEAYNGKIPNHLIVRHKCDNPRCCNIAHLELGTHKDNSQDMKERNRQAKGSKNGSAKLSENDVIYIRHLISKGESLSSIGRQYSVSPTLIMHIRDRKIWTHI